MTTLLAWLGDTDLRASCSGDRNDLGPILRAIDALGFDSVHLLSNRDPQTTEAYRAWLKARSSVTVTAHRFELTSPTNYVQIYHAATQVLEELKRAAPLAPLTFHLSPGTSAMAALWVLLAKTAYPARLIEASREKGVEEVRIPFDLSAEFFPAADPRADEALTRLMQGLPPQSPAFTAIVHRCAEMKQTLALANRFAQRNVPVLIQGESGTGKELLARAIHQASARSTERFVAVNCGAIPPELVDSELFGHEQGAFTGASKTRLGYFESADRGTLFLDEIGELPLASQVRLLRVLQESEVTRLGATKPIKINIRIIAATNRTLPTEVREGRFREDLFYRLAVGVLVLPPLRNRKGDLTLLIETLLSQINVDAADQEGYQKKTLDVSALNALLQYVWPGNVRQLHNVLVRSSIWAVGNQITADDVAEAMAFELPTRQEPILDRSLETPISLHDLIGEVKHHYLKRALTQTNGNKTEAARILGLSSHQTITNWLERTQGHKR